MRRLMTVLMTIPVALTAAGMQATQTEPGAKMPGMPMMMNCPMNLQGTSVAATDTATGVDVTFTTKAGNVTELRRRVEQMAAMHSAMPVTDAMKQGQMMPGTVKYQEVPDGAKLTLTPSDPAKLAEFRKQVRTHVERMQKGECAMMQEMMQGKEPAKDQVDHSQHHPEEKK